MMVKKRNIFLAILLPALLVACANASKSQVPVETKEKTEKEAVKEIEKQKEVANVPSSLPHFLLEVDKNGERDEGYHDLYRIAGEKLKLKESTEEFKALSDAIEKYNRQQELIYQADLKELQNFVSSGGAGARRNDDSEMNIPEIISKTYIIRADKRIVSLLNCKEVKNSGDRLHSQCYTANFDSKTGKELAFSDVVKDDKQFFDLADKKAEESSEWYRELPSELVKEILVKGNKFLWTVSAEGVSLYFDGYMDEEKQKEPIMLSIYFDEGEELFTEQYKNRETDYLIPFIGNAKWEVDVDGDGKRDSVYAKKVNTDVWDGYDRGITGLKAAVNGLETELIEGFDGDAYLLKKSGKYYMYVFMEEVDDATVLYRIDLARPEKKEGEYWSVALATRDYTWDEDGLKEHSRSIKETFSDIAGFYGESRNDVLSSNTAIIDWVIGEDAYPSPNGERYKVYSTRVLHSLREIPAKKVDGNGEIIGDATIPADSYLLFMYSDNETWADMRIVDEKDVEEEGWGGEYRYFKIKDKSLQDYDGPCYRIQMERDNETWSTTINGIEAEELLEGIMYAG